MSSSISKFLVKSCNQYMPVDEGRFLLPFLSPTSPGTNYWDSPTEAKIEGLGEREVSRIVAQVDEILKIIHKTNYLFDKNQDNITLLDVGTGNGMVPKLISSINKKVLATGIDPFLHGGHKTSWQKSKSEENMRLCIEKWNKLFNQKNQETLNLNNYNEYKRYLEEHIEKTKTKYKVVYCKAIEHVPNWMEFSKQLSSVLDQDGLLIIKHRSFFSYLGPHRYSTTAIPWGHCLLNDIEYTEYARKFHPERSEKMTDFYFNDLSNPRMTISELIRNCNSNNLDIVSLNITKPSYAEAQFKIIQEFPQLIDLAIKKNPPLSYEEMTSGLITLVFQKRKA